MSTRHGGADACLDYRDPGGSRYAGKPAATSAVDMALLEFF